MEKYPAINFAYGATYFETDRTVTYRIADPTGTGNINHTTLTWVSGPLFSPYWVGSPITVNGVVYTVAYATSTVVGFTTDSGLVTTGLNWTMPRGMWQYDTGLMKAAYASAPADLNVFQDINFLFEASDRKVTYQAVNNSGNIYFAYYFGIEQMTLSTFGGRTFNVNDAGYRIGITDYQHQVVFDGTNWDFAPGDPGSKYLAASADGTAPNGGVWGLCDGSAYNVFKITAGVPATASVTTPNLTADTFLRGGTFTGSVDPTSAPTFVAGSITLSNETATHTHTMTGNTDYETNHTHTLTSISINNPVSGTPTQVVAALTTGIETGVGHRHVLSGGATLTTETAPHTHTVTGTGAISAPTVGSGAPRSFALNWYMRR
jgi:hypothetical protein